MISAVFDVVEWHTLTKVLTCRLAKEARLQVFGGTFRLADPRAFRLIRQRILGGDCPGDIYRSGAGRLLTIPAHHLVKPRRADACRSQSLTR